MKVYITKLAAAQRQLRAAIRMFFGGEDELAVHTVVSAAYRIITDLKKERGQDEVGDYYLTEIFYCVRDYRRGTLPAYLKNDQAAMNWIREMAEKLPIDESTKYEDIKASVSADVAKEYWKKRNKTANFLKHADRDPKSHIPLGEIDNLSLLMQTLSAYFDLVKDNLGAEGLVLWLYFSTTVTGCDGLPKQYRKIAAQLKELNRAEGLDFCSELVNKLNASPSLSSGRAE